MHGHRTVLAVGYSFDVSQNMIGGESSIVMEVSNKVEQAIALLSPI